jgi:2-iminobutanoate/2-iminopropanoate deaminase
MKKYYRTSESTNAPLSGAVEVGDLVFVSGQIHWKNGVLVGETIQEKFAQVMKNVADILKEAGLTIDDIVRVHLYLTDLSELKELNEVYMKTFKHPLPARTAVGVMSLPLGASLEMDVIASRNSKA